MKISTKGRYGLRFLIELAKNYSNKPILLKNISINQNISLKYLEQIAILLKNSGLIKAFRGKNGGYMLAKSPEDISVYEVLKALEGDIFIVDCIKYPETCERYYNCETANLWKKINNKILNSLISIKLKDLIRRDDHE